MSRFIPRNDTFPVISIKFNIHIWREDDGTGNRWLDTPACRDTLRLLFEYANNIASHNVPFSDTILNAEFVSDPKYRFILDSIYYYDNTIIAHTKTNRPINEYVMSNYPERIKNVCLHFNLVNGVNYSAISTGSNPTNGVHSILFVKCNTGNYSGIWADAIMLNHEIGHNFGLDHPYGSEINYITHCEFLWDLFGHSQQS